MRHIAAAIAVSLLKETVDVKVEVGRSVCRLCCGLLRAAFTRPSSLPSLRRPRPRPTSMRFAFQMSFGCRGKRSGRMGCGETRVPTLGASLRLRASVYFVHMYIGQPTYGARSFVRRCCAAGE